MKKIFAVLFFAFPFLVRAGGFVLTWENDSFVGSDSDYTHGMDVFYIDDAKGSNLVRSAWGFRHRMYSPDHVGVEEAQSWDRPWCGVTTLVRQWWYLEGNETVLYDIEAGVLGPSAEAEFTQTQIHRMIGSRKPLGWDNQFPDEPAINGYMERHHPIVWCGEHIGWQAGFETVYGGTIGTTYVNGMGGVGMKAGWNIPREHMDGIIGAKNVSKWSPFIYGFVEERGYLVAHNATLGHSYFNNNRDGEQELEPTVMENRAGVSAGVNGLALTYIEVVRSDEFKGQTDGTDYGMLRFEFVSHF